MQVDEKLLDFIGKLRDAGLQVSLAESMDALEGARHAPLTGLEALKAALQVTLVKRETDLPLFSAVFDDYFCGARSVLEGHPNQDGGPEEPGEEAPPAGDLQEMVREALMSGDSERLRSMAGIVAFAVGTTEGGFGAGSRPLSIMAGSGYYLFRAMEMLKFSGMSAVLEEMVEKGELMGDRPPLLALEELSSRIEEFRSVLEREIKARLAAARGDEVLKKRKKLPVRPEEIDFTDASLKQVEEMRRVLPALSRKLAARLARKKGAGKRGRVDIRNTIRHSISSGGVPIDVKYRRRVFSRPELFVLCDVSGSVRTFSTFTLQLVYSLHQQFSSVRSFTFIDRVDEVTEHFEDTDVRSAIDKVYRVADVVDGDGHTDVGRALEQFSELFLEDMSPRSTVIILSDARNNARDPRARALEAIKEKARKVYWLNPEPREKWDVGDSVIEFYREGCHSVHECRNLKQLAEFVYRGT